MNEQILIKHCLQQNRRAQKQLYEKYYAAAYRLSRRYLGTPQDAEDVLISAFARIFRHLAAFEYREEGSLQKWINTIVINECIRFLSRYRPFVIDEDVSKLVVEKEWDATVYNHDAEEVMQLVTQMPDGYRTIFNLYAIEGYTHAEIAEMLNISVGTSKSQLSKARNYLMERLNKTKLYGNQ